MATIPTLEVLKDHLSLLSVAKASPDDCAWIKVKSSAVFEYSGGEHNPEANSEDAIRRKQLVDLDATRSILLALDAMTRCASNMQDTSYSADHIDAVCFLLKILRNLARDKDESIALVTNKNACQHVRDAIIAFGGASGVCRESFGVLTNLAAPPVNRSRVFSECGTIIVAYASRHSGDVRVAQHACACLVNIANDASQLDDLATIAGSVIIELGVLHAKDATVAEHVESALSAIVVERDTAMRFLEGRPSIIIDLMLDLMRMHLKNPVVCEHGLRCIYSLAQVQENKLALKQGGSFAVMQSVLASCPFGNVAEWGCKATRAIAHNNVEMKQHLHDAGAVGWVIGAIRAHGNAPFISKAGLSALWSLANLAANKGPMVITEGAHIAIINALRLLPDSTPVALTGTAALASLANESTVRRKMLRDGIITVVLLAMRGHRTSALVAEHGCGCLWSMCMDQEVQNAVTRDAQAVKAVLEAITLNPSRMAVITKGLGALENLAASPQGASISIEAGAVPVLSSILKVHLHDETELVVRCCNVLATIAHYSDDATPFQKYGVAEIAIDVERVHPTDDRCSRAAERLLTSMEGGKMVVPT